MTVLVCLWGARLTFNAARKGGFRLGGEDYRWAEVRARLGSLGFQVPYAILTPWQMFLIWLFTGPRCTRLGCGARRRWGCSTSWRLCCFLRCSRSKTVADEQMWAFQQDKKRRARAGEQGVQPFLRTGLRRYSRHPNYLGEIGMWWVFYLFAVAASGQWMHWTGLGFVCVTLQIVGLHSPHREDLRGEVPGLPRLPGFDAGVGSVSSVPREGASMSLARLRLRHARRAASSADGCPRRS